MRILATIILINQNKIPFENSDPYLLLNRVFSNTHKVSKTNKQRDKIKNEK